MLAGVLLKLTLHSWALKPSGCCGPLWTLRQGRLRMASPSPAEHTTSRPAWPGSSLSSFRPAFPLASLLPAESYDEYVERCAVSVGRIIRACPGDGKCLPLPTHPQLWAAPQGLGSYPGVETGPFYEPRNAPNSSAPHPNQQCYMAPSTVAGCIDTSPCRLGAPILRLRADGIQDSESAQTTQVSFLGPKRLRMQEPYVSSRLNADWHKASVYVDG